MQMGCGGGGGGAVICETARQFVSIFFLREFLHYQRAQNYGICVWLHVCSVLFLCARNHKMENVFEHKIECLMLRRVRGV